MTPTNTSVNTKPDTVRSRFIWPRRLARSTVGVRLRTSPDCDNFLEKLCYFVRWLSGLQEPRRRWQSRSTSSQAQTTDGQPGELNRLAALVLQPFLENRWPRHDPQATG